MDFRDKFNKLLFDKKSLPIIIGFFFLGFILIVFSGDVFENNEKEVNINTNTKKEDISVNNNHLNIQNDKILRLEEILSKIKGVGRVDVEIVFKATPEKIPLKITDAQGNETAITENTNSKTAPFITKENYPEIDGILIVCEGGGNDNIKKEIIDAVSNVYNVPVHKVKVFDMKDN